MGYNWKICNITGMFILGTFFVQPGDLIPKTDKCLKNARYIVEHSPGSSCHGTDGHQHFRNQCLRKQMPACTLENQIRQPPKKLSTALHTAFVYGLQHHQDSLLFLEGLLRWSEVPRKKIYLRLGCFLGMLGARWGWLDEVCVPYNWKE